MTLKQEVQRIASSYTKKKKEALLVIGLIHQGETHVFHFGDHPIQKRVQPEDVIFEIGSISKVFTTSILASMMQKGQMKLDNSISLYCPHIRKNHPIQIEQLATHTSGLPPHRLLRDLQLCFLPKVRRDMFCQYSLDELMKLLNSKKWNQPKSFPSRYSNVGMGLLGLIMGWSRHKTYEQLLMEYIVDELHLSSTFITIKDNVEAKMILGHRENGKEVPPLHMLDYQGAGAIRSTITDLLSFLSSHLHADADSFGKSRMNQDGIWAGTCQWDSAGSSMTQDSFAIMGRRLDSPVSWASARIQKQAWSFYPTTVIESRKTLPIV